MQLLGERPLITHKTGQLNTVSLKTIALTEAVVRVTRGEIVPSVQMPDVAEAIHDRFLRPIQCFSRAQPSGSPARSLQKLA